MVIIKLLQRQGFDLHTQNFFRYLAASVVLQAVAWKTQPEEMRRCFLRPARFLIPAFIAASFQTIWVMGVYKSMPAAGSLVTRSTVLWGLFLSFLFFRDERGMMRSPAFIVGVAVALTGLCGFILSKPGVEMEDYSTGLIFLAVSSVLWAAYGVSVKLFLREVRPVAAFATTASLACIMLLAPGLAVGDLAHIARAPWGWSLLLLASGPVFIGGTQILMFESIRRVGVAATNVVTLSIPLATAASSFIVLDERLTPRQWLFGAVLIGGLAMVIFRTRMPAEIVASPPAPPPPEGEPAGRPISGGDCRRDADA